MLYSEKYLSGLTVFCIYILVDAIRFTNSTLLLSAAGKTKILMLLGGGALAITAVLNIGLYKAVGFSGPAVATLVITLLFGIILLSSSAKELGTGIKAFFDVKHLVLFLGESVIVALPLIWVRSLLVNAGMNYFVILVVTCGLYAAVMLALNWKEIFRSMKEINVE